MSVSEIQKTSLMFKVTENERERRAALKIIQSVFVEELGYRNIRDDRFNDIATLIIAKLNERIIGALRLIPDTAQGLPVDSYVDLSQVRKTGRKLAEGSRLACLKEYRSSLIAFRGLAFFAELAEQMGITHIICDSFIHTARLYKRIGFKPTGAPFVDPTICLNGDPQSPNAIAMVLDVRDIKPPKILCEF